MLPAVGNHAAGSAGAAIGHVLLFEGSALTRAGRRRNAEVLADLACEAEGDLTVPRYGSRSFGVEAPEAVVATFAQERRTVRAQVSLKVAALHAAMTSSSGSLSAAASPLGWSPNRSSSIPRRASTTFARA